MPMENRTSPAAQAGGAQSADPPWQCFKAGDWTWQVNPAFATPALLRRLEQPELLLRSPTRVIKAQGPTQVPLVAQVDLPEIPGGRVVIKRYQPRHLLQAAKLFFRPSSARRELELFLAHGASGLPLATMIAAGECRRWNLIRETYLISPMVADAQMLHAVNQECADRTQRLRVIRSFARTIAALHEAKISHADPSLANFLVRNPDGPAPQIVIIDLDALKPRAVFSTPRVVKDLYRLLHRSHAVSRERLWFLAQYCRARSPRVAARDLARGVYDAVAAAGYEHGLKPNQVFGEPPDGGLRWQVRWPMVTPQVETILRAPDRFLEQANVLKPSRSSALSVADGVVLKRYNYRKWTSRFKDVFRLSRGRRAFQQAYRLELAGVPTARPIAAADRRCLGLVTRSYLVMAEIPGAVPLPAWTGDRRAANRQVARLLARLHDAGFTHRDLKGGNLLFDSAGRPHLIDLDGLRFVRVTSHRQAARDLARLARDIGSWRGRVSRSDRVRFLMAYCRARKLPDWRWWWRAIEKRLR